MSHREMKEQCMQYRQSSSNFSVRRSLHDGTKPELAVIARHGLNGDQGWNAKSTGLQSLLLPSLFYCPVSRSVYFFYVRVSVRKKSTALCNRANVRERSLIPFLMDLSTRFLISVNYSRPLINVSNYLCSLNGNGVFLSFRISK